MFQRTLHVKRTLRVFSPEWMRFTAPAVSSSKVERSVLQRWSFPGNASLVDVTMQSSARVHSPKLNKMASEDSCNE